MITFSGIMYRGVAQYFFFRSILMKRHFDTFASEVWAKYTSEEKFAQKCIKLTNLSPKSQSLKPEVLSLKFESKI